MSANKYSAESRHYNIGTIEINRYTHHGLAHVRIDTSIAVEVGCFVDTSELTPQPVRAWIKRRPSGLDLIVASPKAHGISEDALEIDSSKRLEGFLVGAMRQQAPNKDLLRARYDGQKV